MQQDPIVFTFFLVFTGAAIVATLALYFRQALLVAYILLGALLGPWGLGLVGDPDVVREISHIGIMFLLFLLGLDLNPRDLLRMLHKTTLVTVLSSLLFGATGGAVAWGFGYNWRECLVIGAGMSFSSTIIGLKLLPTTVLHHQRTGEVIISILLLQDLLAIGLLLLLQGTGTGGISAIDLLKPALALPGLVAFAWVTKRYVWIPLVTRFDQIREYIFLMAIGWCLGIAELANVVGLSVEIGAFVAGVTLAAGPIAIFIAESLRPLRDFFLVLFFFSVGAGFDLSMLDRVWLPATAIAAVMLVIKPIAFRHLLVRIGESAHRAHEIGFRLGQMSEFALLIAVLALEHGVIGGHAAYLIQLSTVLTLLVSSTIVVLRFPTPIAISDRLRRD